MKKFNVSFLELDRKDSQTGKVIFQTAEVAKNKIRATDQATRKFKQEEPEVYARFRHFYFIETKETA